MVLCTVFTLREIANRYHVSTTHTTKDLLRYRIIMKATCTSRNMYYWRSSIVSVIIISYSNNKILLCRQGKAHFYWSTSALIGSVLNSPVQIENVLLQSKYRTQDKTTTTEWSLPRLCHSLLGWPKLQNA